MLAYGMGLVIVKGHLDRDIIFRSLILGVGLGILSVLLYFFFYLSFSSQAAGILPYVFPPTRLPQYLVMFGTFIFLIGCFLVAYLRQPGEQRGQQLKLAFTWWWRILLICIGLYLFILLLIALVLFVINPAPDSPMAATLQTVFGWDEPGSGIWRQYQRPPARSLADALAFCTIGSGACQCWQPVTQNGLPPRSHSQ